MGNADHLCECVAILCSYGVGKCLASLFPPQKREFAEKAIRVYAYQVYSMVMLGLCFFVVGIVALILGIVFVRIPGSGQTLDSKVAKYNENVKEWTDQHLQPMQTFNPTVYFKGSLISMSKSTTADSLGTVDAETKKQLQTYSPLKYTSGEVELVPAGTTFNPNLYYSFLISSSRTSTPRNLTTISVPVYINQTIQTTSDFICSAAYKGYFNSVAKVCTQYLKLSSICILVDAALPSYESVSSTVKTYGCGLTNNRDIYDAGKIRFKEAAYEILPITNNNPTPVEDGTAVLGSITIRDASDPFVQLSYNSGGSISFTPPRSSPSPLLSVGIIMFCIFGFSCLVIFGLCLGGCTSTRQKIIAFIILEESRVHTASTTHAPPPTGGSFVQTTVVTHQPGVMMMPDQYGAQPMQPMAPGMMQPPPMQPGMMPNQYYQPGMMMQPPMQQMQPMQPGVMPYPQPEQYPAPPGGAMPPMQPGYNPYINQTQPGMPQQYQPGQYPTAPYQ